MSDPVELHYTHRQLAVLLGNQTVDLMRRRIKRREFGPYIKDGENLLVAASGVHAWRASRVFLESPDLQPIPARTEAELRRKAGLRKGNAVGTPTTP